MVKKHLFGKIKPLKLPTTKNLVKTAVVIGGTAITLGILSNALKK